MTSECPLALKFRTCFEFGISFQRPNRAWRFKSQRRAQPLVNRMGILPWTQEPNVPAEPNPRSSTDPKSGFPSWPERDRFFCDPKAGCPFMTRSRGRRPQRQLGFARPCPPQRRNAPSGPVRVCAARRHQIRKSNVVTHYTTPHVRTHYPNMSFKPTIGPLRFCTSCKTLLGPSAA